MNKILFFLWLLSFQYFAAGLYSNSVNITPVPAWVVSEKIGNETRSFSNEADSGYQYLLVDTQENTLEDTCYSHVVYQIVTEAGVQNASDISVSYDPAYQTLYFHKINIIRGKNTYDKLNALNFKTIQRETDLDKFLYDGRLSAILFLDDVRKGDIIEYSYSIKGGNPIFNGRCSET